MRYRLANRLTKTPYFDVQMVEHLDTFFVVRMHH